MDRKFIIGRVGNLSNPAFFMGFWFYVEIEMGLAEFLTALPAVEWTILP